MQAVLLPSGETLAIKPTRRRNSIALKVTPEGNQLMVPNHLSQKEITKLIEKRLDWIETSVLQQKAKLPEIEDFDGKTMLFFGEAFSLNYSEEKQAEVDLTAQQLLLPASWQKQPQTLKKQLVRFGQQYLQSYIEEQINDRLIQLSVEDKFKGLQIKNYKSRWGSCYPDGRVQLNWRLIMAPKEVIDYVLIHELCHLHQANHSPKFWQLVEQACPNYRQHQAWLKHNGTQLMAF